ncbi:PREDICTED: golgin candidate 1-like [Brassica oleracea var. oleracea]|nr:PREDICTED: golgin candidate 1-like [Brassica oleracea var. oleracea]
MNIQGGKMMKNNTYYICYLHVCAGLSSRLQDIKEENAQLEEPLTAKQELTKSHEASIRQLQKDLSSSKSEVSKVESRRVEALAATNSEVEALVSAMDALKTQAALNEGKLSSLQVECTSLNQELQDMEVRPRRGKTKSTDEPNQLTQIQAWQGEVDHARHAQRDAEEKLASMEAEMQQVRVEMVAMKRDAENYGLVTQAEAQKVGDSMVRP